MSNKINSLNHNGSEVFFVVDDLGMPVSFGYPTREKAEKVAELIEVSEGNAKIPDGVDVEKLLHASR